MDPKSDTFGRLSSTGVVEEFLKCPSCECKLQNWEVRAHFEQEMEHLRQLQLKASNEAANLASQQSVSNGTNDDRRKPWTVFQRVQRNRQSRLKQRTRKRPPPPPPAPTGHPCPVCSTAFPHDEIQRHTEQCLRRSNGSTNGRDGSSSNEEDDGDEYEEYEWAGQKRIRVSSLVQGGYAALGIGQTITNHNSGNGNNSGSGIGSGNLQHGNNPTDEDEDLNVDEDDTHIYGPAQYGEADVIPPATDENDRNEAGDITNYVRRLMTVGNTETSANIATSTPTNCAIREGVVIRIAENNIPETEPPSLSIPAKEGNHYQQVIESLKARLRQHENQVQGKFKCLICLDDYRNPAISVSCWHVHCEECWLRSLGARKLCPQCNLITTPKDLRRIYM